MKNNEITTIDQTLIPLSDRASLLEIIDPPSLKEAVSILSQLNQINDRIVEERERVTKPLNEALKAERSRWKPTETRNQALIDDIRQKMTTYQTNLLRAKQEAELAITARIKEGKGNYSLDTAVKKIEALPEVNKETATEEGLVQFREKKQLLITNIDEIPREYMLPDEIALLRDLKAGNTIAGVTLETIQVPVNYR